MASDNCLYEGEPKNNEFFFNRIFLLTFPKFNHPQNTLLENQYTYPTYMLTEVTIPTFGRDMSTAYKHNSSSAKPVNLKMVIKPAYSRKTSASHLKRTTALKT